MKKFIIIALTSIVFLPSCSFLANSLLYPNRQPLVKNPSNYEMEYEDIEFYSPDSVLINGWYIPANSEKLIVFTHPMNFTRYGYSIKHQKPFKITKVEVEFLNVVKQLHNADYNVLMFDFRNHGESGKSSNNGITGVGINEWQDVQGAFQFIHNHARLKDMQKGIVANCMGANSAIIALTKAQKELSDVKCLIAIQPISSDVFVDNFLKNDYRYLYGLRNGIEKNCLKKGGYPFKTMTPEEYVDDIPVPVFYMQVENDDWTDINQVKSFYEKSPEPKELFLIPGKLERFDGYNYFGKHPEKMLEFLSKYMVN